MIKYLTLLSSLECCIGYSDEGSMPSKWWLEHRR